jgi:hypothetical protein
MIKHGAAVFENVRRYRTIASLYRQTAAFRPLLRRSLLAQAEEWEQRAVNELEAHFQIEIESRPYDEYCRLVAYAAGEMRAAA